MSKKKRVKKDKDAPKKALSAFMFYSSKMRKVINAESDAKLSIGEMGKEIGRRWALCTAEDKEEFDEQAKDDKVRYADAMKVYNAGKAAAAN